MSCCYPDTNSPGELWNNVLAGRRAFRRIPLERLRLEDYFSADVGAEDSIYSSEGAFIEGYEFDRVRFRIAGSTYRSADLAHWLALDVAARALADAGFDEGEGLPREATGVFLGNTLTGEFSRAGVMRLRWPYVRRVAEAALVGRGLSAEERRDLLSEIEETYKRPFPPVGAETLAGGLSNTIAGRICNHFDFKGGGYTVDGACASSLLAVTSACTSLMTGDLDVALAGGVDVSIDPFELVGFAKTGALARDEMRVYDRRSAGFWPGEGCGVVVLMRLEDAQAMGARVYAVIRGWGVSSDGSAGITRPEVEGQMLALERAYRRAGYGIETVAYFEGHGTGTNVGDTTELKSLSNARRLADPDAPAAAISSIKANIGHTKAAAGVAGLLKAAMALYTQTLPPTVGCTEPHDELKSPQAALRVLRKGECWPAERHLRAGVSAMGFGGINTHITLEGAAAVRRRTFSQRESEVLASAQDAELFLLAAPDRTELLRQVEHLLTFTSRLSRAELTDLAVTLGMNEAVETPGARSSWRACVVASTPTELTGALGRLRQWLVDGAAETKLDVKAGVFLGTRVAPRIGFLFPGQAAPVYLSGGALARRFATVEDLYARAQLPVAGDARATELAQPSIVTASMAGLRVLDRLGIVARVGVGHSLGELSALHWAGAMCEDELLRLASLRAHAMTEAGGGAAGRMVSIRTGRAEIEAILNGDRVSISGFNAPRQTVVAGEAAAVEKFVARVKTLGHAVVNLNVSHAFHTPLMEAAVPRLLSRLRSEEFSRLQGRVISTVTGACLTPDADLPELLGRQLTAPVRFVEAATAAAEEVDLFIEVGPGHILTGLVNEFLERPCVSLDAGGESLKGLLKAVGAAFAAGVALDRTALFSGRYTRPFSLDWQPRFFRNPCELAPLSEGAEPRATVESDESDESLRDDSTPDVAGATAESALELVRLLVAERAELPPEAVCDDHRLLSDLHLNSLTVSQLVVEAARRLGLAPPSAPTEYALATVAEMARALEEMAAGGSNYLPALDDAPGVAAWVRSFTVELSEQPAPPALVPVGAGDWRIFATETCVLAPRLREAFARLEGNGVVVCLPPEMDERHLSLLLEGARAVSEESIERFVLVQQGRGAAAFARSLKLEIPRTCVTVVNVPAGHAQSVEWVLAEASGRDEYTEVFYDEAGVRRVPVLRPLPSPTALTEAPLGAGDLILVTGGGKGIAAECALSLALESGAALALLGRSQPAGDAELSANLERMTAAGIRFRYVAADVTDAAAVREAIARIEAELGCVTAVLHGAGVNTPRPLHELDEETFGRTLAPKVRGARNVLSALDPARLRLFVTFGSLIARTGMRGEADYAVANEWLTDLTAEWQAAHPHCRCLAIEWSVWSGVGMGQRLGSVDALIRQGITPISVDEGIRVLRQLLDHQLRAGAVLVTGRFGSPPTLRLEQTELPLLRFLEECKVHYPGVELVVEARLSAATDLYLRDHVFQGEQLFPAVLGLEAMAQAAHALTGATVPPCFESVKFERPVAVPPDGSTLIRIAALVGETGAVEVVLRSEQTAFQVDHFRAVCRFPEAVTEEVAPATDVRPLETTLTELPAVALEPVRDIYGHLLFHEGRFRRVRRYQHLTSTECVAEIERDGFTTWFGPFIPGALLLGDPGRRDATIHAIQSCVPRATILPVGVERLEVAPRQSTDDCLVHALERSFDGQTYTYDVEVRGTDGRLWERWEGLRLRAVGGAAYQGQWAAPLLGPHLERRVRELVPGSTIRVAVEQDASVVERSQRSERAVRRLVPSGVCLTRRPDGKPELSSRQHVSLSHARDLTLAVVDGQPLACDAEVVAPREPSVWRDLLGPERFALAELLTRLAGEELDVACTRVWAAGECVKKVGAAGAVPLTVAEVADGGWVSLNAPPHLLVTYPAEMLGSGEKLVFAVLAGEVS
jgi:enediyne polyketide synthase